MNTFGQEVERIRNELADLGCRMTFGMSCLDLAQKIYADVVQKQETNSTSQKKFDKKEKICYNIYTK